MSDQIEKLYVVFPVMVDGAIEEMTKNDFQKITTFYYSLEDTMKFIMEFEKETDGLAPFEFVVGEVVPVNKNTFNVMTSSPKYLN